MRAGGRPEACRLSRRIETTDDGGAPRFRCRTLAPYPVAASDPVPAPRPRRGRNRVPRRAGRRQGVGCGEGRKAAQPPARGRPRQPPRRASSGVGGRHVAGAALTRLRSGPAFYLIAQRPRPDSRPDTCQTLGQFTTFRAGPSHETIDESAERPPGPLLAIVSRMSNTTAKSAAILAARHILRGDVHFARLELVGWTSFSPAEGRAIIGACREANRRYGCKLDWSAFLTGDPPRKGMQGRDLGRAR